MSAPRLSIPDAAAALDAAERIALAFSEARRDAGHDQKDVASRLGVRTENIQRLESGREKNLKLGTIVRALRIYGLEIAVVPAKDKAA